MKNNDSTNPGPTPPGPVAQRIEEKLADAFALDHLEVINESSGHNVPAGSESHFKVVLVADVFAEMSRIARHRAVHEVLSDEMAGSVHALAIHAYGLQQWRERFGDVPLSPPCLGGKAAENG